MGNFKAKSAIVSRKPNKKRDGLWNVLIALFDENNAHLKGKEPTKVLEYAEIEEVKVEDFESMSFFPTGNDVVINDLTEVEVAKSSSKVVLKGRH